MHFPLERMAHTHYKNHPVEIKLYIHLQSSELAVGYILMRKILSDQKEAVEIHEEKNLREKCRKLFIIMGIRQIAFKKH